MKILSNVYFGAPLQVTSTTTDNFLNLISRDELGANISDRSEEFIKTHIEPNLLKGGAPVTWSQAQEFTETLIRFYKNVFNRKTKTPPENILLINNDATRNSVYDLTVHTQSNNEVSKKLPTFNFKKNSPNDKIWENRDYVLNLFNRGLTCPEIAKTLQTHTSGIKVTIVAAFKRRNLSKISPAQYKLKERLRKPQDISPHYKILNDTDNIAYVLSLFNQGLTYKQIAEKLQTHLSLKGIDYKIVQTFNRHYLDEISPAQYKLKERP
jgi:DNA-binding NarL/FixJ family response regulator